MALGWVGADSRKVPGASSFTDSPAWAIDMKKTNVRKTDSHFELRIRDHIRGQCHAPPPAICFRPHSTIVVPLSIWAGSGAGTARDDLGRPSSRWVGKGP